MGMAAHAAVSSRDGSVFAHLHPGGSISMAALQRFQAGVPVDAHAAHGTAAQDATPSSESMLRGEVAIPYAFPKAGVYRLWVQVKRSGRVMTAAYDVDVK
jgi:hypothetical protein